MTIHLIFDINGGRVVAYTRIRAFKSSKSLSQEISQYFKH